MGVKILWLVIVILGFVVAIPVNSTMLGGYSRVSTSNEGVQRALAFAVAQLNSRSNEHYYKKATNILEASTQVVSGMKYRVKFEFSTTRCIKQNEEISANLDECDLLLGKKQMTQTCDIVVWEQVWLDHIELISWCCRDAEGKGHGECNHDP